MANTIHDISADKKAKDPLLQPFKIRGLTIKNRVMSTSHAISYQENGKPGLRYQLYQEEKAKGGMGLTMFGGSSCVSPDSPSVFGQLDVSRDDIIPYFQQLSQRVHHYDCKLMCQITHMGRRTTSFDGHWLPMVAPSRVREMEMRGFPKVMDEDDITRIIKDFSLAARRCKQGGLDGLEVMSVAHLVWQFLAPETNLRTDKYGGSLENRARFALEVFEAIRKVTGDGFILGIRMPVDEEPGGLQYEEAVTFAHMLKAQGIVDFINGVWGRIDHERGLVENHMPGMFKALAPYMEKVGSFRREVNLPIFHATRILDPGSARTALREGYLDMAAMTRAHIADPHIVAKIMVGQEDRIRPCVGAGYCSSTRRVCIQNAATGREEKLSHMIKPSDRPGQKVVIVGGGPAGMEAARVSALRGHEVILYEAASQLGGQVQLAARASWRKDMAGITAWLGDELNHLHVTVKTSSFADISDVLAHDPDIVVIATGGIPDTRWVTGHQHVISVWDVLGATVSVGQNVLIYDGTGQNQASSCADFLAESGKKVEVVSPDPAFGQDLHYVDRHTYRKRFYELGITLTQDHIIHEVIQETNGLKIILRNVLNDSLSVRRAESCVIEHGTLPMDDLFEELRENSLNNGLVDIDRLVRTAPQDGVHNPDGGYKLFRVGDAVSSRDIHSAIFDSLRLCSTF